MSAMKRKLRFIVEKTNTGYSAFNEKHGIYTTGDSVTDLFQNVLEATELRFEESEEAIAMENIGFDLDFEQFFKHYRVLNAKYLAERIGMSPSLLSQYIQGKKIPSKTQKERILNGIHEIGRELSDMNLIYS